MCIRDSGRRMDAVGAKFTSFLNKNHIVSYPDTYVASTTKHPMNFLVEFIKKKKWHKKILVLKWMTTIFLQNGIKF